MKKIITLISILSFLFSGFINAQQVYKGGGTSNSTFLLGYASYAAKSQCIFWPSDLTNAASGNITTIYYKYGSNGGMDQVLTNFTIQMGQTPATAYDGDSVFFTGLTPVFNSPTYTIPAGTSGTWFPISLTTPFTYSASQTLIIQLTFDASAVNSWGTLGTSNTPTKKIISGDVNAMYGDPSSATWQDMGFDLAPTGIRNINSSVPEFNIYPNPVHDKVTIAIPKLNRSQKLNLTILNSLGEKILEKDFLNSEITDINVSGWDRGIYFIRMKAGDAESVRKIVLE